MSTTATTTTMSKSKFPDAVETAAIEVEGLCRRCCAKYGPFNSLHEAESVLREEFEELWDEVKKRERDPARIRSEARDVASVALRIMAQFS
jgi:hypothetical protein